jgi:cytochrome c
MLLRMLGCALGCAAAGSVFASPEVEVPEAVETCLACHAYQPDEPEMEGPTLWRVVGRPIASVPDYPYSEALRRLRPGTWDRATLERFLAAPQDFAPGANMTFGGVRDAAERKVVLDFLEKLVPGAGDD